MQIDYEKLEEGLKKLRGIDFESCETAERTAENYTPVVSLTKSFQARVAARALGCPYEDIKELPLREYLKVCQVVNNFLHRGLDVETSLDTSGVSRLT